jgi:hypothetical protein
MLRLPQFKRIIPRLAICARELYIQHIPFREITTIGVEERKREFGGAYELSKKPTVKSLTF